MQIVAHSLGGLMAFAAMREHPEKYSPGAVVVGVPFGTGIQYFQDLHKGERLRKKKWSGGTWRLKTRI